jgi:large subunit ribosomal protein L7/L12
LIIDGGFKMPDLTMDQVVEYIANLTLLQAAELKKALEAKLGVSAASVSVAAVSTSTQATAVQEAPKVEEKTSFDVVLIGFGDKKIQVIKAVRQITNLGLKEAKDLVEAVPKPLKEGVTKEEADKIKAIIDEAGGTVDIK